MTSGEGNGSSVADSGGSPPAAAKSDGLRVLDQGRPFQPRAGDWVVACFGDVVACDELERMDRAVEEFYEALQTRNYPRERLAALEGYVWGRPVGETRQEIGGVMMTLAAWCCAIGVDMHEAGETELARVWTKVPQIRAKQAAKPTGSALPIALSSETPASGSEAEGDEGNLPPDDPHDL